MTDETRLRFLTAIAKQLDLKRLAEIHFFPAMRQGGVESGVAVIALEREQPITVDVDGGYVPPSEIAEAAPIASGEEVVVHDQLTDESAFIADETTVEPRELASDLTEPTNVGTAPLPPSRYTVFSARYRHTLKGPDRGKWEVSVIEEADAPLVTVDAVVRGVQRRSGESDEIARMSGDEARSLLPEPAP